MSYETFVYDRDVRGRPAEYLLVSYFKSRGIEAVVNDAPEEDRDGRRGYDAVIGGEAWEIKTDFASATTKRIFVERASLEHTQSYRFAYFIPTPYGFEIRIFTTDQLMKLYNETNPYQRGDGTNFELFKYKRAYAGDQSNNEGVFIPMDVVKAVGLAPWEVAREIKQSAHPAE